MSQPLNNISLAENSWLPLFSDDETYDGCAYFLDPLLSTTKDFWNWLEVYCVPDCCGIDAFRFWKEDIKKATENTDSGLVLTELRQIKAQIECISETVIDSRYMNVSFGKKSFIQLLNHLIDCVQS